MFYLETYSETDSFPLMCFEVNLNQSYTWNYQSRSRHTDVFSVQRLKKMHLNQVQLIFEAFYSVYICVHF